MDVKGRLAKIIPRLLLTLLIGPMSVLSLAQPADPPPGPPDPEMMLQRLTEQLNLSDQQQQDLAAAFAAHRASMRADGEKMMAAREALDKQVHAAVFDEAAIRQASSAVAALEADRAVGRGKLYQQIRGILTPDQLQKFEQMREERQQKMEQWHGGDFPGPGGPHHRPH